MRDPRDVCSADDSRERRQANLDSIIGLVTETREHVGVGTAAKIFLELREHADANVELGLVGHSEIRIFERL